MIDTAIFLENLKLTQAYCEGRIKNNSQSVARVLRSLNCRYKEQIAFDFSQENEYNLELVEWNFEILENEYWLTKEFFEIQLRQKRDLVGIIDNKMFDGRILVSNFEWTVTDGVSEIESKGLVDIYDLPPIDTWFYLSEIYDTLHMYAWIPEKFIPQAELAMAVNIVDAFFWLEVEDLLKLV